MLTMSAGVKPAFMNTVSESKVRLMVKAEAVPVKARIARIATRARILGTRINPDMNARTVFSDFILNRPYGIMV